ncbi:LamB/YcsF family protein [Flavobacteriaceae bacterium]|nr:LamB/YcsF family protein [Flavobacteriaceae bacterium]MDC1491960.1 LamB/YcsF family protein [Flavobacteriaceae bacterium]
MKRLKINSDVGEGVFEEKSLMPYLNTCSIACGGHYGDIETMNKTAKLAIANKVLIGAHPSYPDKINFGRKDMFISSSSLKEALFNQISSLLMVLNNLGLNSLDHIKAHGALYHKCFFDVEVANSYIDVVKLFKNVKILAPYGSVVSKIAEDNGVEVDYEVFLDRNYNNDLTLISRGEADSMIENSLEMSERYKMVVNESKIKTFSNNLIDIVGDTFCVHGDTKDSHLLLKSFYKNYFSYE